MTPISQTVTRCIIPLTASIVNSTINGTMKVNQSTISASQARSHFYELLTNVAMGAKKYQITRRGHAPVVMLSLEEFEMYRETLALEQDTELMKDILDGQKDIAQENFTSHEDMKKDFGL